MRIILTQNVHHLGFLGDEVTVKRGYARNYLVPRGMAISASSQNAVQLIHRRKHLEKLRLQAIEAAKQESDKVSALEITLSAKAGANGRLFGSVTNRDIQAALAKQGYDLDRRSIQTHTRIRNVGNYTVTVRLHSEVKTDVTVRVVPLGEAAAEPDAAEETPKSGSAEDATPPSTGEADAAPAVTEGSAPAAGPQPVSPEPAPQEQP